MNVTEIMTRDPESCSEDMQLEDVAQIMAERDCGFVPVCRGGIPVGAITDRDITVRCVANGQNPLEMRARDCMSVFCITVAEDSSLEECVNTMQEYKVRRVPVVDSEGICSGIVSQADIAKHGSGKILAQLVQAVSAE
jgi:CBS domain-containing protein